MKLLEYMVSFACLRVYAQILPSPVERKKLQASDYRGLLQGKFTEG